MQIKFRQFVLIEASLLMLALVSSSITVTTEARYVLSRRAVDQARVARPVFQISSPSESQDLGEPMPGCEVFFEFTVDNGNEAIGVSEVALDYRLTLMIHGPEPVPWHFTLEWIDAAGEAHVCQTIDDRTYLAQAPLEPQPQRHHYRLRIMLPIDAEPAAQSEEYSIDVLAVTHQLDR